MVALAGSTAERPALLDSLVRRFPLVLAGYFALQTLRRLIEPHGLGLDEAEQIVMTQVFAWGYGSQPPLYSWIQKLLFLVLGESVLALALLKNAVLFLTCLFVFLSAERVLGDRLKAAAVTLSLFFIPQFAWESQRALVHTPMVVCAAAATFLVFIDVVEKRRSRDYVLFGIAIAVGVLSKYSYPLFVLGLLAAALTVPVARRAVFDRRMFLVSLPVSIALTLPTMLWSLANLDLLLARTWKFEIAAELPILAAWTAGLIDLVEKTVAFSILCAALYAIAAFAPLRGFRIGATPRPGGERFPGLRRIALLTPLACLALLAVFVIATGTTEMKDRWLQPYLFLLPLACFIVFEDMLGRRAQIALASIGAFLALFVVVALLAYNRVPDIRDEPPDVAAPYAAVADELRQRGLSEVTFIGVRSREPGNLLFHLPDARAVTPEYFRMPIEYPLPAVLAWEGRLNRAEQRALEDITRATCSLPPSDPLGDMTLEAPYIGSERHMFSLHVAVLPRCDRPGT